MDNHKNNYNLEPILLDSYILIKVIGSGSFGEVYLAKRKQTETLVAIKIEERKKESRIIHEYKIYKKLSKNGVQEGIPEIYDFLQAPNFNIMCMELLGSSLDELFNKNNKTLCVSTVLKLGMDIVSLLQKLHKNNIIHRDIKPNNFLIGKHNPDTLYIMDFGLSKEYVDKNGSHINLREGRPLIGTARYASINMHMGIEPTRRDDLESVGYMLIYFINGSLPWQGLKKKDNRKNVEIIGDVKMCTNLEKLCKDMPKCFTEYIIYCRKLKFDEEPDYNYLIDLFKKDRVIDKPYEWI